MPVYTFTALYNPNDLEEGSFEESFEASSVEEAEHKCRMTMAFNCIGNNDLAQRASRFEGDLETLEDIERIPGADPDDIEEFKTGYHGVHILSVKSGMNWDEALPAVQALGGLVAAVRRGDPAAIGAAMAKAEIALENAQGVR
jgi:hypothetical protein